MHRSDDVLYFLHIPKTAGATLIHNLDNHFDSREIFPALLLSDLLQTPDLIERLNSSRFIRGHFDAVLSTLITRPLKMFTVLRDPVARTVSQIRHARRAPEVGYWDTSKVLDPDVVDALDEGAWLETDAARAFLSNVQVGCLTSEWAGFSIRPHWDVTRPTISDENRLAIAQARLDQCCFVGIQERFDDSLRLLSFTVGLNLSREMTSYNLGTPGRRDAVAQEDARPEFLERVRRLNDLDATIYDSAVRRFERDFEAMSQRLDVEFPELAGELDEQLAAHHKAHLTATATDSRPVTRYDFGEPLEGSNWYQREKFGDRVFRWTGPGRVSTLCLPVHRANGFRVLIETLGAVEMSALESFRLRVNDVDIPVERRDGADGPLFVCEVPSAVAQQRPETTFAFVVGEPVDVGARVLGLCVLALQFSSLSDDVRSES